MSVDNPMSGAAPVATPASTPTPAEAARMPSEPASTPVASEVKATPAVVEKIADKAASGEKLTKQEQKTLKEYKIKVNGRDEVVKFDPSNDEEVVKHLQKARASDSKFAEANEVRKAAMEFIEELRKNPRKVLTDPNIGIDVKKLAEEIINEQIADMEKTPEQKEREKLQKELEDLRKQAKDKDELAKKESQLRLEKEYEYQLENDITAALDVGGLPKTPRTVKMMAEMMMIALNNGIDLSAKDIAPIVKNTNMSEFQELVKSLSDDQLESFLGKETIGRLRKKNLAKALASKTSTVANVQKTSKSAAPSELSDKLSSNKKIPAKKFFGF